MKKYYYLTLLLSSLLFISCGKGLAPEPEEIIIKTGFGGQITFKGNWPEGITRTHIVAFKHALKSAGDFSPFNLGYVSDSIPYGVSSFIYNSTGYNLVDILPGEYDYIAVAQSRTPQLSLFRPDWFVVGIYYANGDTTTPGKLFIEKDKFTPDINIICDFDNPPPQPPGRE